MAYTRKERDFSNANGHHEHLDARMERDDAMRRIKTAGSISISPELFEKLYLSPKNENIEGDAYKRYALPTPIALIGFLLSLTPLSFNLMGFRGSTGVTFNIGAYFFFGGLLMFTGSILEWVLGNTFSFVVFGSFSAFWFTIASTNIPAFNAYAPYATDATRPATGATSPVFLTSYAWFLLFMGLLCVIYLVCSLKTNMAFVIIFATLMVTFGLLTGTYLQLAQGNIAFAGHLQVAAGASGFVACLSGWWIFTAQLLASVDFPFSLPVGDLSGMWNRRAVNAGKYSA